MKTDLLSIDDLNKIKNKYKFPFNVRLTNIDNDLNYGRFRWKLEDIDFDNKLELLKNSLEKNKNSGKSEEQLIKSLEEIKIRYGKIKEEAKLVHNYSDKLIQQIEADYIKNQEKEGAEEVYKNVSVEIMEIAVKNYIKLEKDLILLIDKFNSLCSLYS